ncbi:MAG: hypothetical protein PHN31_00480 [Candidatus Gracilibacteria bacterium]|nr:hypothetical protein [Candidatus Gracilibacteria bacterium]
MAGPRENPKGTEEIDVTIKEGEKNDNDNELKIPKKVLDKIKTKFSKLEGLVIDGTKDELTHLKNKVETANTTMNTEELEASLRKEVIEERVENGESKFDALITGVRETSTEQIINDLGIKIGDSFNSYNLTPDQIDNIKTGITQKILKSGGIDNALKVIDDYLKGKEKGTQDATKLQQKNTMIDDLVKNNSADLKGLFEKNKDNKELLNGLLSNSKAIEEYREGTDISNIIALQGKELQDYLLSGNDKVVGMDKKMGDIRKQASNILNNEKISEYMKKGFIEFIEKILKFFGISELGKTILEDYNKSKDMTKSVENLKSYGIVKIDGVEKEGKNHKSIKLLDGKDLTNIQTGKLESFFTNCKEKGIDITKNDFWPTILSENNENKTIKGTVKEKVAVQNQLQNPQQTQQEVDVVKTYNIGEIKAGDIDTTDFTNFYKKLNNIGFITEVSGVPKTEANPSSTTTQQQEQKKEQEAKKQEDKVIENLKKDIPENGKKQIAEFGEESNQKTVNLSRGTSGFILSINGKDGKEINKSQDIQINSLKDVNDTLNGFGLKNEEISTIMNKISIIPATPEEAGANKQEQQRTQKEKEEEKTKLSNIEKELARGKKILIAEIGGDKRGSVKQDLSLYKENEKIYLELKTPGIVNTVDKKGIEGLNSIDELKKQITEWDKVRKNSKIEYKV